MGNKSSSRQPAPTTAAAPVQTKPQPQQTPAAPAQAHAPAAPKPVELGPVDIVISATAGDNALVDFIKGSLEKAGNTVYSNTAPTDEAARMVGKMLVDAKMLIFIVSTESSANSKCGDQVSLAYISNKPIVLLATKKKEELMTGMSFGLKLTLQNLPWMVFEADTPSDDDEKQFLQVVQQYSSPASETVEVVESPGLDTTGPPQQHKRIRMNTKLRSQTTQAEITINEAEGTFWERNFDDDEVLWYRFEHAFLADYDTQISSLFTQEKIPWLLGILKQDIFGGSEKISKNHFMQIRGDSPAKHAFWKVVSQIAVEKFNMQEVFNMQSTVRLTAVENLGKFQNPAVIEALLRLLEDEDPNVRAVAAISLGRTGVKEEFIVDKLIGMTKDGDRIVRQSVCLTLGAMKAVKAIPHISNLWRNDFISVVRDAARTALEKMDVPEAQDVLKVTRVLEEEIKHLEGKIVQV